MEFIGYIPSVENVELMTIRENLVDGQNFGSILTMVFPSGKMENVPLSQVFFRCCSAYLIYKSAFLSIC